MSKRKPVEMIIKVENLKKSFWLGDGKGQSLDVLRGISLEIEKGQIVAVVGPSGAGKSTLLHIIGTLDRPTSGKVYFQGVDVHSFRDERLARFRNENVGFVFQFHHLLPEFTAIENVAMPLLIGGEGMNPAVSRAKEALARVGLEGRAQHKPSELSGGEQQRVAVARALVNSPMVVLADEPTGNLDSASAAHLNDLIWDLCRDQGQTFVIVTHNEKLSKRADSVVRLADGRVD